MHLRNTQLIQLFLISCLPVFLFATCSQVQEDGIIIVSEATDGRSQIVMIDPSKPSSNFVLTSDYYSANSPDVSWDGRIMLFAGQQKENDTWQIWEMDLKSRDVRKITDADGDCTDPVSMPNGKLIFSKARNSSQGESKVLFECNPDGSEMKQLTFHPYMDFSASILADGRLLAISRRIDPKGKDPMLMALRPDGTKADLFYAGLPGHIFEGRARESENGKIFFVENDSSGTKGNLVSVNYKRPLFSREVYSESIPGSFRAVYPVSDNILLVAYSPGKDQLPGLYEFDALSMELGKLIYSPEGMNITDVVLMRPHVRPKKLPSEVDMGVKTGLLLCQNINFTGIGIEQGSSAMSHVIEIIGVDSSMGKVNVEEDGSFYLKVIADKPFQIQKLDKKGTIISRSDWIWLRPNERRGCIGCHENPELAPDNRVPMSVKKDPVNIPVHITDIFEKEVELE